jgi:hypothetical protein
LKTYLEVKEIDRIRAEGAEIFIQSMLMLEYGIPVSVASRNMPAYDLIAHNVSDNKNCLIQVKYRKAKVNDGVRVKNFNFNFLAVVLGQIGKIGDNSMHLREDQSVNEVYIIPQKIVYDNMLDNDRFAIYRDGRYDDYKGNYKLIYNFLYGQEK